MTTDEARSDARRGPITRYGVRKDVQHSLSRIRTDLDSFADAEAYALMTSGYRMADFELKESGLDFGEATAHPGDWRFLALEPR